MQKRQVFPFFSLLPVFSLMWPAAAFAAEAKAGSAGITLWELIASGGTVMVFLLILSAAATASIIYHFRYVRLEKVVPQDFVENLLFLLDKKEFEKATSVCKQQQNIVSAIALKGLLARPKGAAVAQNAVQNEGKAQLERIWQHLNYLGDMAAIAPLLGLLGTILGMIDAFHYFKAGSVHPGVLTQGLAKAMINTAMGLVIAVPALGFYSYFRGKISRITSSAESAASEVAHLLAR